MSLRVESENDRKIARARALARVLDTAIRIPGTSIRLGLDPLLGLIPGAGDAITALLSSYIILTAARQGASRPVLMRMIGNVVIDTLVGSIPVLGDLFDVAFKSNARNAALLERLAAQPGEVDKATRRLGILVGAVLLLVLFAVAVLGFFLALFLWRLLTAS